MTKFVKIEDLSQRSAARFFSDAQLQADPVLVAAGWERRFTADAQRVQETMELYSRLGYEVRAEPIHPQEFLDDCEDCRTIVSAQFRTIYTRKRTS